MKPREIEVHIEELILHGFEPAHRCGIGDALQRQLDRPARAFTNRAEAAHD